VAELLSRENQPQDGSIPRSDLPTLLKDRRLGGVKLTNNVQIREFLESTPISDLPKWLGREDPSTEVSSHLSIRSTEGIDSSSDDSSGGNLSEDDGCYGSAMDREDVLGMRMREDEPPTSGSPEPMRGQKVIYGRGEKRNIKSIYMKR